MKCESCQSWIKLRKNLYGDGIEKILFQASSGAGFCEKLNQEVPADFGCVRYFEGPDKQVEINRFPNAAWTYFSMGPCPDCRGNGSHNVELRPACNRCAGTGNVRYYDDGFIGEERTRLHPNEIAKAPKCLQCKNEVKPTWHHCPECGFRLPVEEQASGPGCGEVIDLVPPPADPA